MSENIENSTENKAVEETDVLEDQEAVSLKIKLKKPVTFEGKTYLEIDLSDLENWTCDNVIKVSRAFNKSAGKNVTPMDSILPEANLEYDLFVAAKATKLPVEFFKSLPARESGAVKTAIISFFNSEV